MNPLKKLRSFFKRSAPKKAEPIVKKVKKVRRGTSRKVTKMTTVGAPLYFTQEKARSIVEKLHSYIGLAVEKFELEKSLLTVSFKREGKAYDATFTVTPESEKTTYELVGEVLLHTGKKLFTKRRNGLDYSQVEPALMFIFHQTFTDI